MVESVSETTSDELEGETSKKDKSPAKKTREA